MNRPIEEIASRAIRLLKEAQNLAEPFNDYGSVLGALDESEEIYDDLKKALHSASRRSNRLKRRIELWNEGNREARTL